MDESNRMPTAVDSPRVADCLRLAADLARYGPQAEAAPVSLAESRAYCCRLARSHYENFTVASWLLPRRLRPHFYHVYAYCRWSDDLADEVQPAAASLALLDWWQAELDDCYRGATRHPVFVALRETIGQFDLPREPFVDLLTAFRRDQQQTRYDTMDELLDYCRYSANPVGRLVLQLDGSYDASRAKLSDSICTGLQLINFWQDIRRDHQRGRVYLPREICQRFGYDEAMHDRCEFNSAFAETLADLVARAETMLTAGRPLIGQVSHTMRIDVELFIRGGLAVARAIRNVDFDVWHTRPTVSKLAQLRLLASCAIRNAWDRSEKRP